MMVGVDLKNKDRDPANLDPDLRPPQRDQQT